MSGYIPGDGYKPRVQLFIGSSVDTLSGSGALDDSPVIEVCSEKASGHCFEGGGSSGELSLLYTLC